MSAPATFLRRGCATFVYRLHDLGPVSELQAEQWAYWLLAPTMNDHDQLQAHIRLQTLQHQHHYQHHYQQRQQQRQRQQEQHHRKHAERQASLHSTATVTATVPATENPAMKSGWSWILLLLGALLMAVGGRVDFAPHDPTALEISTAFATHYPSICRTSAATVDPYLAWLSQRAPDYAMAWLYSPWLALDVENLFPHTIDDVPLSRRSPAFPLFNTLQRKVMRMTNCSAPITGPIPLAMDFSDVYNNMDYSAISILGQKTLSKSTLLADNFAALNTWLYWLHCWRKSPSFACPTPDVANRYFARLRTDLEYIPIRSKELFHPAINAIRASVNEARLDLTRLLIQVQLQFDNGIGPDNRPCERGRSSSLSCVKAWSSTLLKMKKFKLYLDFIQLNLFVMEQYSSAIDFATTFLDAHIRDVSFWNETTTRRIAEDLHEAFGTDRPYGPAVALFAKRAALYASKQWARQYHDETTALLARACQDDTEHWHTLASKILVGQLQPSNNHTPSKRRQNSFSKYQHQNQKLALAAKLPDANWVFHFWRQPLSLPTTTTPTTYPPDFYHFWGNPIRADEPDQPLTHMKADWKNFKPNLNNQRCLAIADYIGGERTLGAWFEEAAVAAAPGAYKRKGMVWCLDVYWEKDGDGEEEEKRERERQEEEEEFAIQWVERRRELEEKKAFVDPAWGEEGQGNGASMRAM